MNDTKKSYHKIDFLQRVKFIGKNAGGEECFYRKNGGEKNVDVCQFVYHIC